MLFYLASADFLIPRLKLIAHTASHAQRGGDCRQYADDNLNHSLPSLLLHHLIPSFPPISFLHFFIFHFHFSFLTSHFSFGLWPSSSDRLRRHCCRHRRCCLRCFRLGWCHRRSHQCWFHRRSRSRGPPPPRRPCWSRASPLRRCGRSR